jgi:uncharacterized membrane protein
MLIGVMGLVVLATAPIMSGKTIPLPLPYNWHKWLHIFGAVLFLGNIIVTAFWMVFAIRTKQDPLIRFAAVAINWADVFFTAPGVILLFGNGMLLSQEWGNPIKTGWIAFALALFILSGLLWIGFLIPVQDRMARLAEGREPLGPEFFTNVRKWYFFGIIGTILPLISMALMVLK